MQTIFVPLDFSENSLQALRHAIQLAKTSVSKIIVFHSYQAPQMGGGSFTGKRKLTELGKQEAEDNMYKVVMKIKEVEPNLDFEHLIVDGDPMQRILFYSESYAADLIVMGTKGASGMTEVFLGSVAAKIINDATCPVVIVPQESEKETYERIVYATALIADDKGTLNYLKGLATDFKAKLECIHVEENAETNTKFETFARNYNEEGTNNQYVDFKTISKKEEQKTEDVLLDYVQENPLTLLVMLRRERDFLQRLFGHSVTNKMAYHSESPLLIMKAADKI
ncbi:universal stress protein UspA-like protein [Bernardetia litoralis DSM 6794]|uniref:Universal stress protein UspA-like protein n=1 Tax=Bernardetia litoralis (strain ATCC 23117 / DSM 6794 / NBRC 15988 / NCIMB 1366 / Fx l1 / Sio-4) TaxID=880071 RepID=I4AQD9_BERLS|nr:universal stress protein [Bernardetia litoralis]AFM06174.1 universal stress protein UspA-like protein [Bernardetia litoralis DSM 6794]